MPDTSAGNFFWPLIVRGLGMGLLSVPVSTMSLSTLKGQEIGQGAAFSGMMRQLGGSFGVASISTYLLRETSVHRVDLVSHMSVNDANVQHRVSMLAAGMRQHGLDSLTARNTAYQMLDGAVNKQANLMSYMDVFMLVGIIFVVFVPVVLLVIKKTKAKVSLADAGH
jgi:DHA2 family multidrug resistance protein